MPATESIYRRAALERLSSPEQLDQLVGLTSPLGWLAAAALAALVILALIWSVVGSLPVSVAGAGILVTRGGQVFDAMASASGTLVSVADIGHLVKKGEVVATLDDTELRTQIAQAEAVLRERDADLAALRQSFVEQIAARHKNVLAQKSNLIQVIAAAEARHDFYRDYLQREAGAIALGFISQRSREETRHEMDLAEQEAGQGRSDLLRLDAEELDLGIRRDHDVLAAQQQVNEARRHIDELTLQLDQGTKVVSAEAGVVTELKATPGSVMLPGKPVLSIETTGQGLQMLLYVPPQFGKAVRPGMEVRIEPSTVKKEEYGTLLGRVLTVSDFPMTEEGMMSVLQNQQLARQFMAQGPPYATRVELIPSPQTPSGYRWSGGRGPQTQLSSGTTATADITIARRAPISLVLPAFKNWSGYGG